MIHETQPQIKLFLTRIMCCDLRSWPPAHFALSQLLHVVEWISGRTAKAAPPLRDAKCRIFRPLLDTIFEIYRIAPFMVR